MKQPTKKDAVALYLWNMALCGSLYPLLHCTEVALRNAIHDALYDVTGNRRWFDDESLLWPNERNRILEAEVLLKDTKEQNFAGRVVAEVAFGYWTGLFSIVYERTILQPIMPLVFWRAPKRERCQSALSARVQRIRDLRNRAFHHEPIWKAKDLRQQHAAIVELLDRYKRALSRRVSQMAGAPEEYHVMRGA